MKPINNYGLSDSLIDTVRKAVKEALVGGQKKLDVDKDGKLEKTDFASLRAKKDAVDTKPKLKEDHPDEKEDKALIKKLIKKADVSDDEEDKALIKKTMKKEEEQMDEAAHVKTNKYSWGTMKTVHQGSSFSIPLHPEHHEAIAKLKDQQEHKFKDETGHHWTAKRQGDDVHFQGANGGNSTKVPHKAIAESKEDVEQMDETEEQIDELSRGTLKSYVKKAYKSAQHYSFEPAVRDPESGNQYRPTYTKRSKGIDLAKDKLKREDVEQMDEISSELAGRASNARIDRNMSGGTSHTDIRKLKKGSMTPLDQQRKTTAGYMKTLDRKNEEVEQMDEVKLADLPRRFVPGRPDRYGANYVDPEGADDADDMKKAEPKRKSGPQGTMKRRFIKDKSKLRMQFK